MSEIVGDTSGSDAFISDVKKNGTTKVENPNDEETPFEYPNWYPTNPYFSSNKIIWPKVKPPSFISLVDTASSQFLITYGISYLSYYFYMLSEDCAPGQSDYDNLFVKTSGYQRDIDISHNSTLGIREWGGAWLYESIDIKNIKGGLCKIDVTVSQEIVAGNVVDKKASAS